MALTRDFRETVQARVQIDKEFRRGLLSDAVESLLAGEAALGREILRDFINATIGFPTLAERTGIHVKTLHQMFGPKGNPTATNLFNIIACLQEHEGVRLQVVAWASVQSQVSAAGAGASANPRLQQVRQFIDRKLNIAQDRTQQARTNSLTGMYRNCGGSAVRVSEERVTSAGAVHREACSL